MFYLPSNLGTPWDSFQAVSRSRLEPARLRSQVSLYEGFLGSVPANDSVTTSHSLGATCSNSMDQCTLFRMWTTTMYVGPKHQRTIAAKGLESNIGTSELLSIFSPGPFRLKVPCTLFVSHHQVTHPHCHPHLHLQPLNTYLTYPLSSTASTPTYVSTYIVRVPVLPWCLIHTSSIPANPLSRRPSLPSLNGPPRLASRPDCSRLPGQLVLLCTQ